MTFFAQLLERSGVVTRDRAIGVPPGTSASVGAGQHRAPFTSGTDTPEPAIREVHEERVVQNDVVSNTFSGEPQAHIAAPHELEAAHVPAPVRLTSRSSAAPQPTDAFDRRTADRDEAKVIPPRLCETAPTPAPDIEVVVERTAPRTVAPRVNEPPESLPRWTDALAQARAWTARTPLRHEIRQREDRVPAPSALPIPVAGREAPRKVSPASDAAVSELHVHIGTIEVVIEQPRAVPEPIRTPSIAAVTGAPPASRRLARHHLRG